MIAGFVDPIKIETNGQCRRRWLFIIIFIIIFGYFGLCDRFPNEILAKRSAQKHYELIINESLYKYFLEHNKYAKTLGVLITSKPPYLDIIPIDPVSEKSDWLVTSKCNFLETKSFFTQEEFTIVDNKNEGVYRVKAKK